MVGGRFLKIFTEFYLLETESMQDLTSKLPPDSPNWIGAWWIGFLMILGKQQTHDIKFTSSLLFLLNQFCTDDLFFSRHFSWYFAGLSYVCAILLATFPANLRKAAEKSGSLKAKIKTDKNYLGLLKVGTQK